MHRRRHRAEQIPPAARPWLGPPALRPSMPTTLNYLAIHSNDSFWTVQKDQASLSAVLPTTPRRPVQTGRLRWYWAVPVCLRGRCDAEPIEGAALCAGGGGEDGGEAIA